MKLQEQDSGIQMMAIDVAFIFLKIVDVSEARNRKILPQTRIAKTEIGPRLVWFMRSRRGPMAIILSFYSTLSPPSNLSCFSLLS